MNPTTRRHYEAMLQGLVETHIMAWHREGKSVAEITQLLTVRQNRVPGPSAVENTVKAVIAGYESAERSRGA